MWTKHNAIANKKPSFDKLEVFGFFKRNKDFCFEKSILSGQIRLVAVFSSEKGLGITSFDTETGDEYILAYIEDSSGEFVGKVKYECECLFDEIVEKCFDENVFKMPQTKALLTYAFEKYGTSEEYLWPETPNNAILRHNNSKWYAAILTVAYKKIGIDKEGVCEVVNLKESTENIAKMPDGKRFLPAFHMNKKHWYTLPLDGSVTQDEAFACLDRSYDLIDGKRIKNKK